MTVSNLTSKQLNVIQIGALGGAIGDHVWVAVEDGRIAAPGTHLDCALFRWMYPRIGQLPVESIAKDTSALPRRVKKIDKRRSEYRDRELSVPKKVKIENDKAAIKGIREIPKTSSSTPTPTPTPLHTPVPRTDINNSGDGKVSVWDSKTHSWLVGDMAPSRKHLQAFLASRPHCRLHKEVRPVRIAPRRRDESAVICDTSIPEYWTTEVSDVILESNVQGVRPAAPLTASAFLSSSSTATAPVIETVHCSEERLPLDNRMQLTVSAAHPATVATSPGTVEARPTIEVDASLVISKRIEVTAMMACSEEISCVTADSYNKYRYRGRYSKCPPANGSPHRTKADKSPSPRIEASNLSTTPTLALALAAVSTSKPSDGVPAARTESNPSHDSGANSHEPACSQLELSIMDATSSNRCVNIMDTACAGTEYTECDESNAESTDRVPDKSTPASNIEISAPDGAPFLSALVPSTCSPIRLPTLDFSVEKDRETSSMRDDVGNASAQLPLPGPPVYSVVLASVLSLRTKECLEDGEVEDTSHTLEDAVSDAATSADCTDTKPVSPIAGDVVTGSGALVYSTCLGLSDNRDIGSLWRGGANSRGAADSMQWKQDFFRKDMGEWRKRQSSRDVEVRDDTILHRKDLNCHDGQLPGMSKTERSRCDGRSDGASTDDGEEDVSINATLGGHRDREGYRRDRDKDLAANRRTADIVVNIEGRRRDVSHFKRHAPDGGYAGYSLEEEDEEDDEDDDNDNDNDRMDGPSSSDDASQLVSTASTPPNTNPNTDGGLTVLCDC